MAEPAQNPNYSQLQLGGGSGAAKVVDRRHSEWREHELLHRWLQDSYEGGDRYRNAVYGMDRRNLPIRNLLRHKREYPPDREGMPASMFGYDIKGYIALDDPYEIRRQRTPVPRIVAQAVNLHLAKIYAREVDRDGPPGIKEWWSDVDGAGTSIDDWMTETIAPLLMTLGQLDLIFDHPAKPEGADVTTLADEKALGLNRCVAGYILPENMLWWRLAPNRRYAECLVREWHDDQNGGQVERFRHWTTTESTLYDRNGEKVGESILHKFGRVPIVRVFDVRKPRLRNTGQSRYEEIAEIQREVYNRASELIVSDSLQCHAILQGPEEWCEADKEIPIGPGYMLPMRRLDGTTPSYQGFEFLDPPKGAAESLRQNVYDLRDQADRSAFLTKPAGAAGTTGKSVAQSGVSKQLDQCDGNNLLTKIASVLARAEKLAAEFVLVVLSNGKLDQATLDAVEVAYPTEYDLYSTEEMGKAITEFQAALSMAGDVPETEAELLTRFVCLMLPGLSDERYEEIEDEIEQYLATKAEQKQQSAEMAVTKQNDPLNPAGDGQTDNDASTEPGALNEGGDPNAPLNRDTYGTTVA